MFFNKRKRADRESLGRLTAWALGQGGSSNALERQYGAEHAQELGPLGWLFRAIELAPQEEPPLGRWQRWESELRARLSLLPPPRRNLFATALPPLLLLPLAQPAAIKAAVGDVVWKSAAVALATSAITVHVVSSGALQRFAESFEHPASSSLVAIEHRQVETHLTGNSVLDRVQLNQAALEPGDVNLKALTALTRAAETGRT